MIDGNSGFRSDLIITIRSARRSIFMEEPFELAFPVARPRSERRAPTFRTSGRSSPFDALSLAQGIRRASKTGLAIFYSASNGLAPDSSTLSNR
jgi:hypothetical protein